jgi:hypothetical protein
MVNKEQRMLKRIQVSMIGDAVKSGGCKNSHHFLKPEGLALIVFLSFHGCFGSAFQVPNNGIKTNMSGS